MTKPEGPILAARRISVVGSTGSGKTFLARELSCRLGLPHHELDELKRDHSLVRNTGSPFVEAVLGLVAKPTWVIDGHYRDVRHLVWSRCDLVVHLNYSPVLVIWRLIGRYVGKNFGRRTERQSAGKDLGEIVPPSGQAGWKRRFARLVKTIRERREYAQIFAGQDYSGLPVIELKSPAAARRWLDDLDRNPASERTVRTA